MKTILKKIFRAILSSSSMKVSLAMALVTQIGALLVDEHQSLVESKAFALFFAIISGFSFIYFLYFTLQVFEVALSKAKDRTGRLLVSVTILAVSTIIAMSVTNNEAVIILAFGALVALTEVLFYLVVFAIYLFTRFAEWVNKD